MFYQKQKQKCAVRKLRIFRRSVNIPHFCTQYHVVIIAVILRVRASGLFLPPCETNEGSGGITSIHDVATGGRVIWEIWMRVTQFQWYICGTHGHTDRLMSSWSCFPSCNIESRTERKLQRELHIFWTLFRHKTSGHDTWVTQISLRCQSSHVLPQLDSCRTSGIWLNISEDG